jgi:hypothetical protein
MRTKYFSSLQTSAQRKLNAPSLDKQGVEISFFFLVLKKKTVTQRVQHWESAISVTYLGFITNRYQFHYLGFWFLKPILFRKTMVIS